MGGWSCGGLGLDGGVWSGGEEGGLGEVWDGDTYGWGIFLNVRFQMLVGIWSDEVAWIPIL